MQIEKSVTPHFSQYEVYIRVLRNLPQAWWQWLFKIQPTEEVDVKLQGVVTANDESGLLVQQMTDEHGNLIFTNDVDDIILDNSVRLMLMLPPFREVFKMNGFKPKLETSYKENLSIRYRGPVQPDVIIRQVVAAEESDD